MKSFLAIWISGFLTFFATLAIAATPPTISPQMIVINNTPLSLGMVCGTANKSGYLTHVFSDKTKPPSKTFEITNLFLNPTDNVTCSVYKIGSLTPEPHNFSLLLNFLLIPQVVNNEVRIKSYIEQKGSPQAYGEYNLDPETNTLTVTITMLQNLKPPPKPEVDIPTATAPKPDDD